MKVTRVDGSTSFGYNKTINKQLIHGLKGLQKSDHNFSDILKYAKSANKIETLLRNAQKKGDTVWSEVYHTMLLNIKFIVGYCATVFFPELNYVDNEVKEYSKEVENNRVSPQNGHWLINTISILNNSKQAAINDFGDTGAINESEEIEQSENDNNITNSETIQATPENVLQKYSLATMQLLQVLLNMGFDPDKHIVGLQLRDRDDVEKASESDEEAENNNIEEEEDLPDYIKEAIYVPSEETKKGFNAIGGMEDLKKQLSNRIVKILKDKDYADRIYKKYGIKYPAGILFYGPPGCGKTTITECLSVEADVPLIKISAGTTGSSLLHRTAAQIKDTFNYAYKLAEKKQKPVLVFIDDAESLMYKRSDSINGEIRADEVATFLEKIQEAPSKNVIVIAATNKYDLIDEAGRGRFEQQIYIGLPDNEARKSIFAKFFEDLEAGQKLLHDEKAMERLIEISKDFPARDIKMLTHEAKYKAIDENERDLTLEDFEELFAENQNRKVKETMYKTNQERGIAGFSTAKK